MMLAFNSTLRRPFFISATLSLLFMLTTPCTSGFSVKKKQAGTGFGAPKKKVLTHQHDPRSTKLVDLLKQQKMAEIAGTEIGIDPETGRRGLYATKKFQKDKILCKIPSDLALALSVPAAKGEDARTMAHGGANFLKFYKHNAQAAQQWAFYLDSLPPNPPVTPDMFTDEEIELLEFPRIVAAAKQRQREIQQVAAETGIDEKELQQATALVSSRMFPLAVAEADKGDNLEAGDIALDERGQVITKAGERKFIRLLVPYLDMVNHASSQANNVIWTVLDPQKDDAWFALQATRNIPAGTEITLAYGSGLDSSVELLLNYGFVVGTSSSSGSGNPVDQYMLKKGGDDCIASVEDWTTTIDEDKTMLSMVEKDDDDAGNLQKILQFRIQLKQSYASADNEK